jgi:quinoprotein glucose dehydrogenase
MNINRLFCFLSFVSLTVFAISCGPDNKETYRLWNITGGGNEKILYTSLNSIDTNNVKDLQIAWTYSTHDAENSSQLQVNPVVVNGVLYGVSPRLKLFALDPKTGKEKWVFDPSEGKDTGVTYQKKRGVNICRGIAYFDGGERDRRIFYTIGSFLYCIDISTGKPLPSFGNNGSIDLHDDLGRDVSRSYISATSPGIIYKDVIIMGIATSEDVNAAPGHIRAFDVHTGKMRWIFHTIPYPGEPGYETWDDPEAYKHIGGANVWAGFSLDEKRGIVFAPTGSAADDWYGGKRLGNNLYANSVIALDAATGKLKWSYQTGSS